MSLHNTQEIVEASLVKKAAVALRTPYSTPTLARVRDFLLRERPDVGHVHNWFPLFSPSIYAAHQQAGVPVVQTLHNYRIGCANGTFRREGRICQKCEPMRAAAAMRHRCFRGSLVGSVAWKKMVDRNWENGTFQESVSQYICPSEEVARKHRELGLPASLLRVIPNACPDPLGHHGGGSLLWGKRVVFVGRLVPEKGPEVLLEAWRRMQEALAHTDAELHIIGSGPEEENLRSAFGAVPGVRFLGQLPREEVNDALRDACLLAFPHRWAEPFGLGVIEAMAMERPVVTSNLGGPAELVDDGVDGRVVPPGSVEELQAALVELLAKPQLLHRMGKSARAKYLRRFTPEAHVAALFEVYRTVAHRIPAHPPAWRISA